MSLWRLELLRLGRTRRWLALVGVYVFFGLVGPLTARYLSAILDRVGGELEGATIVLPTATPADGMAQFVSNASQLGTLVVVVVSAGALAFDAVPEMGVFLRTRAAGTWELLRPRLVVVFAASACAFTLGALAAWYETWVLLGALPVDAVVAGIVSGWLFLAFVVAVVAAAAQWTRTVLGAVMVSLTGLLVLPVLGVVDAFGNWLPTQLAGALAGLVAGENVGTYMPATAATIAACAVLVRLAVLGAARREL